MQFPVKINNYLLRSKPYLFNTKIIRCNPPVVFYTAQTTSMLRPKKSYSVLAPNAVIGSFVQRFISTNNEGKEQTQYSPPKVVSIYEGKYTKQILRVKMFSLTTSAMGLMAQPILWQKGIEVSGAGLSVFMCSVAGFFTLTPLFFHFITKKYVIDIEYNENKDEYTCITISMFLFKSKTTFKVDEIHLPDIETPFTTMKIGPKKIPVFVDSASFTDTHHYARFMGYDKPLEFELDATEINKKYPGPSTGQP